LPPSFDAGGAAGRLGIAGLPTIIIDQDGNIRMAHYGYDASEQLSTILSNNGDRLLNP
jgi:hypothetical protein